MKITVLSDARVPTLPDGGHGLGRSAYDIATGLARRGHDVTLFAGYGSVANGLPVRVCGSEAEMYSGFIETPWDTDAYLDTGHYHALSIYKPDWPILNRVADLECRYNPPNLIVNSDYMRERYGGNGMLAPTGIDSESVPLFLGDRGDHLAFMSKQHERKGWPKVKDIAAEAGRELDVIQGVTGDEKWKRLGSAAALLHTSRIDAAPRLPLEAALCGTPTICYTGTGVAEHVEHGVTGWVIDTDENVSSYLELSGELDPLTMRQWVIDNHSVDQMLNVYSTALTMIAEGKRW